MRVTAVCHVLLRAFTADLLFFLYGYRAPRDLHSFPTRRSSDLTKMLATVTEGAPQVETFDVANSTFHKIAELATRSEEHTSELQSRQYLVCRLLLEKKTASSAAPTWGVCGH